MDANRASQQLRRDEETPEARQVCLETLRAAQQLRLDGETPKARQARLQQNASSPESAGHLVSLKNIMLVMRYDFMYDSSVPVVMYIVLVLKN